SVVDAADLLVPAEDRLLDLDVKVDLVVERPLPLVELREAKPVPRGPEGVEVEPLDEYHVVHVKRREAMANQRVHRVVCGGGLRLLRGERNSQSLLANSVARELSIERRGVVADLEIVF